MQELRIKLDEKDIQCLIGGGGLTIEIPHEPQKIILYMSDIGFLLIDKMIHDLETEKTKPYQNLKRINQVGWQP